MVDHCMVHCLYDVLVHSLSFDVFDNFLILALVVVHTRRVIDLCY